MEGVSAVTAREGEKGWLCNATWHIDYHITHNELSSRDYPGVNV